MYRLESPFGSPGSSKCGMKTSFFLEVARIFTSLCMTHLFMVFVDTPGISTLLVSLGLSAHLVDPDE